MQLYNLKLVFFKIISRIAIFSISCEIAHRWNETSLMISQHWGNCHQATGHVDPDLCHHMASLGHNELMTKSHYQNLIQFGSCLHNGCENSWGTHWRYLRSLTSAYNNCWQKINSFNSQQWILCIMSMTPLFYLFNTNHKKHRGKSTSFIKFVILI